MNKSKDETTDSRGWKNGVEVNRCKERKAAQETALGDLEPRAEIKGGSLPGLHKVTDVTLKRGVVG